MSEDLKGLRGHALDQEIALKNISKKMAKIAEELEDKHSRNAAAKYKEPDHEEIEFGPMDEVSRTLCIYMLWHALAEQWCPLLQLVSMASWNTRIEWKKLPSHSST